MKRVFAITAVIAVIGVGAYAFAAGNEELAEPGTSSPRDMMREMGGMMSGRGTEEMQRFMNSERAPQAMASMMDMARRTGNGDTMVGGVRMMEMMGSMGGDGGGTIGGSPDHAAPGKTQ